MKKRTLGKYKRYWFEVDEVSEEVLYYTDNPTLGPLKSRLVGNISLLGAEITAKTSKKHHKIVIKPKHGRQIILATEDEQSLREWFDVLLQTRNFAKTAQQLLEIWKNDENLNTIPEIRQLKENKLNIKLDDDQNENDEETTVDDSSELERTQNEILDIVVQDVEGNPIKFRDVVAEQVTLLVLLRQFGCSVCRQQFGRLVKFQHLFEDLGVRLVAIGNGTPRMAKAFKTEFGFSGPLYVDTPRKLYRALNTRRGLRFFMGPGGALAFFQAKKEGFTSADEILGDPFQLGGMFLWKDEVGFFYQFVQKFAGDFAPFDEVLTLIQRFCWERPELSWCAIPELTLAGKFQRYARVEKDNPLVAVPLALGYTFEPSQRKSENPPNLEPRLLEWCCPYRKEFFYRVSSFRNDSQPFNESPTPLEHHIWYYLGDGEEKNIITETSESKVTKNNENESVSESDRQQHHHSHHRHHHHQQHTPSRHETTKESRESSTVFDTEEGKNSRVGPLVIAIRKLRTGDRKAVIFDSDGVTKRIAPSYIAKEKEAVKFVVTRTFSKEISPLKKFPDVARTSIEMLELESQYFSRQYKFGLLYVKDGQHHENDFYANREGSADYQEFLDFLGPTVDMYKWDRFNGGLNTNHPGTRAIYVEFEKMEIIFHVATLIEAADPKEDPQQIERKRHLGNDVVLLIFKEGNQKFDPTVMSSHFNHAFFVVQKDKHHDKTKTKYRMAAVYKPGVPWFPPPIPNPPLFEKNEQFRRFLLTKLINAEKATVKMAPEFRHKLRNTRSEYLKAFIEKNSTVPRENPETFLTQRSDEMTKSSHTSSNASLIVKSQSATENETSTVTEHNDNRNTFMKTQSEETSVHSKRDERSARK